MNWEHFQRGTRPPTRQIHFERAVKCPYCAVALGCRCIQSGGGAASHSHSGRFKLYEKLRISAASVMTPTEEPAS